MRFKLFIMAGFAALFIAILSIAFTEKAHSNGSGAPAGRTGSPGDGGQTCRTCHSGTAPVNTPGIISSDIPVDGYVPGTTYNLTVNFSHATFNKFGFEISPQNTTGQLKGTLVLTEPTRTQLISSSKYITHKTAGNAGTANSITWTFKWIAPPAGTGSLTFYGAFLAANASNSSAGDAVFVSTLPVNENTGSVSLESPDAVDAINVFPIPCNQYLFLKLPSTLSGKSEISIFNTSGALVGEYEIDPAKSIASVDLSQLATGIYVVEINSGDQIIRKKIIKE